MSKTLLKYSIVIVVALGLGFLGGRRLPPQDEPLISTSDSPTDDTDYRLKYEQLKNKLGQLNQVDFSEYMALREQKEKYQKADEILAKMILIFLADLGLRVSDDKMQFAAEVTTGDRTEPVAESVSSPSPTSSRPFGSIAQGKAPAETENAAVELKKKEEKIDEIYSEDQVKSFLDTVVVDELFDELKIAKRMNSEQMQIINGVFTGKVSFDDTSRELWTVEMMFDGFEKKDMVTGTIDIKMFKPGKTEPFSHANGNGDDIQQFKSFARGSKAILVNAYGDDGYFQLYAPKRLGYLVGNYYEKKGVGSFKKAGTVTLHPR